MAAEFIHCVNIICRTYIYCTLGPLDLHADKSIWMEDVDKLLLTLRLIALSTVYKGWFMQGIVCSKTGPSSHEEND